MIKPTVGRVVHFYPQGTDALSGPMEPLAAIIAYVWHDRMVNLMVIDRNGIPHARTSVYLHQDADTVNPSASYAAWMPYQKAVAAGDISATRHATHGGV